MLKRVVLLIFLFSSFGAQAICMIESHGLSYSCIPIMDQQSNQECINKHGEGYMAFVETLTCSKVLASSLRGEDLSDEDSLAQEVQASCLSYEQGQKHDCQLFDYEPAYNYCAENYGDMYLPHQIEGKCSIQLADDLFGYVSAEKLTEKLDVRLAEAEAIMEMLDREGLKSSIGGLISYQPVIGTTFNTEVVDGLLGKLEKIKSELSSRSQYKVKFEGEFVKQFLLMSVRYLNLTRRIHKIYAYVAHKNARLLKTYNFKKLNYLNLKLNKVFALEIIAQVNSKVKHLENGMVEFQQSEQNKQIYEYQAISEPTNKIEYAKLVTFLGIRENLNNIWAVDKIYSENLLNPYIRQCGNFLSLEREKNNSTISSFNVVKENKEYDTFYNDYLKREDSVVEATKKISLLNGENTKALFIEQIAQFPEVKKIISELAQQNGYDFESFIESDLEILNEAENEDWNNFSDNHFRTIVFPNDGIFSSAQVISRITNAAFNRRLKAIKSVYSALYVWQSDEEHKLMSQSIEQIINQSFKTTFIEQLSLTLKNEFNNYNNAKAIAKLNRDDKIEETLSAAKIAAKAGYTVGMIAAGKTPKKEFLPVTFQDLTYLFEYKISKDFQDIKLTLDKNQKLASVLSDFFQKVAEKFNSDYLVENGFGQMEYKGTDEERAKALYWALFQTAREYYVKNRFEVTSMSQIPEAVLLAREEERNKLTGNPYMIQIYRDGTPVTVHIDKFYAAFQKDLGIYVSPRKVTYGPAYELFGYFSNNETQTDTDLQTDGTFGRPFNYFAAGGNYSNPDTYPYIDSQALERLYLQSLNFSKSEIDQNSKMNKAAAIEREQMEQDYYKKTKQIKDSKKLFARVFELFKIPMGSIANNTRTRLLLSADDQKALANNSLSSIYGNMPVLRNEISTPEKVTKWITPVSTMGAAMPYQYTSTEEIKRPLIQKIGMEAFDIKTNQLDDHKARNLIIKTFDQAKIHIKDKLQKFCSSDYTNYKEDPHFKDAFKASTYLRQNLMSPVGTTPIVAKRISEFDEQVSKDIRSKWKAFVEDTMEPVVLWAGLVALVAAGIVFAIGTLGSGAPASLAAIAGYLGIFLTVEFYVSFPFASALVITRLNTQFIEVPAQLRFQESIAHSQIDFSKIADYDMIEADRTANRKATYWTVGLMPLDLLYGYQVGRAVHKGLGFAGTHLHHKLTGVKLRKYSAPPKSMRINRSFRRSVKENGFFKATKIKVTDTYRNAVMRIPRYQMIDPSLIQTKVLRVAISRKFKELGLFKKPFVILDDINTIRVGTRKRFSEYIEYLDAHGKLVTQSRLNKGFNASEVAEYGMKYSKFGFTIKSGFKALKEGRFKSFITNYGDEIQELYQLQANLVTNKMAKFDGLYKKIENIKLTSKSGESTIDDLLKKLSDEDIGLLEKASREKGMIKELISGKQEGYLRELRQVFKDYRTMVESLTPTSYLYGHMGEDFVKNKQASFNFLETQNVSQYTYRSDSEDIVNFYESIVKQNAFLDEPSRLLRREIEDRISKLFRLDAQGRRVYL